MSEAPTSRSTAPEQTAGRLAVVPARALMLLLLLLAGVLAAAPAARAGHVHFACSKPTSAKIPCYFSTPSRNIRCIWTPHSQNVTCVRVSSRRGFVLTPAGKARHVKMHLRHVGETLPMIQEIVFPQRLACHDTKTSITCNQSEGPGFFTIGPRGSRSG